MKEYTFYKIISVNFLVFSNSKGKVKLEDLSEDFEEFPHRVNI